MGKLTTRTFPLSWHITTHTLVVVTLFGALVFATRQEPFTEGLASGDGVGA